MILFVYGTLMEGYPNHALLADSKFIGYGLTVDSYFMTGRLNTELDEFEDGRQFSYPPRKLLFPYIYKTNKQHSYSILQTKVYGEIYEIDQKCIDQLDKHEGHPFIYKRCIIPVQMNDSVIDSNVYILENTEIIDEIIQNKNLFIPILNGDWKTCRI